MITVWKEVTHKATIKKIRKKEDNRASTQQDKTTFLYLNSHLSYFLYEYDDSTSHRFHIEKLIQILLMIDHLSGLFFVNNVIKTTRQ